jgi:Uma2 family endonuclease
MSTAIVPGQISIDDFLSRPEREDGFHEELIEGEIVLSPNAKKRHNDIVSRIERKLLPLEDHGFIVRGEVACRLSLKSLPNTDAAVFRKDRWDAVDPDDFIQEAPALAVEVVSPGNRNPKLLTKVDLYLGHGAEQVWLIYPKTQTVKVLYQNGDNREAREGEIVEFCGLQIVVSDLFR